MTMDEAARMLADLGIQRRDIVSAPEEGRRAHTDPRQQAAEVAKFKARRAQITAGGSGDSDAQAARLRAWNTETTFERDEVTAQLENRFDGQGHRAGLTQRRQYDNRTEALDARVGEERRQYVLERGTQDLNHSRSDGDRDFLNLLSSNPASPRAFSGGRNFSNRGGAPPPRNPNHARAPSPRGQGTVRFGRGAHRINHPEPGAGTASTFGTQAAANLRAAAASRAPLVQGAPSAGQPTPTQLDARPAPLAPTTNGASPGPTTRTSSTASSASTVKQLSNGLAAHQAPAAVPTTRSNHVADAVAAMKAMAAKNASLQQPGPTAPMPKSGPTKPTSKPSSVQATPKAQPALTSTPAARSQATAPSQPALDKSTTAPLAQAASTIKEAAKTVPPAKASKASLVQAAPVIVTTPVHHDPVRAQVYFNRALWYAANPGQECDEYHKKNPDRLHYLGRARDELIKEAFHLINKNDTKDISEYIKAHADREWILELARKARSLVEGGTEDEIKAGCVTNPRLKLFILAAKVWFTPRVPALTRASSVSTVTESDNSESSVATSASAQKPTSRGTLAAAFYDIGGRFLNILQLDVQAPVHATLNITSRASCYDPRDLILNIKALAQNMIDKSHGLEGVKLAEDGVWEEI